MKLAIDDLIVNNLILRVEDCADCPHPELGTIGVPGLNIWTKDYDVFQIAREQDLMDALGDALRIASEITTGRCTIHLDQADGVLRLPADLLQAMAEARCALELNR